MNTKKLLFSVYEKPKIDFIYEIPGNWVIASVIAASRSQYEKWDRRHHYLSAHVE